MEKRRPHDEIRQDLEHPDGARTLVWSRRGKLRLAVVGSSLALAAAGVAGCGVGGDSQAADASQRPGSNPQSSSAQQGRGRRPPMGGDQQAQFKKFRDCMKQNGVDLPDFSNGPPQGGPPAGLDRSSANFRKAIQACRQNAPQGAPPGAGGPPGGGPPSSDRSQGGNSQGGSSQGGGGSGMGGPPQSSQY